MLSEPVIVERAAQPYVARTAHVTMDQIGDVLPPLHPQLGDWMRDRMIMPSGAPFWKYDVIDMATGLDVEVGVPTAAVVDGDDVVRSGVIPAGRYVTATFTGHPMGLEGATATLLAWAAERDLAWDSSPTDVGEVWGARLEIYETDPMIEPDMARWVTTLAFRLADAIVEE